jgi:hypothetical protein
MRKNKGNKDARKLQVGALFLVNFESGRVYWGTVRNLTVENGEEVTSGDAVVEEGLIAGSARSLPELRSKLSEICRLKLDFDLHGKKGISSIFLNTELHHN